MSQTQIDDLQNLLTLAKHNRNREALEKILEEVVREKKQREEVARRLARQQRLARRRQRRLSLLPCPRVKRVKANDLRVSWVKYRWIYSAQCPSDEYDANSMYNAFYKILP